MGSLREAVLALALAAGTASGITIEYPPVNAVFPPDISAPSFVYRDTHGSSGMWHIRIEFADGSPSIETRTDGARPRPEIDPRAAATTNQAPSAIPGEFHWRPDEAVWAVVKKHRAAPITVSIAGPRGRASVTFQISKDPVGAPIFYRDVPLMPEETEKGVIKPLAASALPLIAWRLRDVSESRSRLLLEGLPTCANCHSFSGDGKSLAMDLDGPGNDKGLYAIASLGRVASIRAQDVIEWSSFRRDAPPEARVGFMSQLSPDARYVVTTVNRADYVANFKDYRFLQVFYPTRGALAWYRRESGEMRLLPGADDPRFVHTGAVWSPDGKYLVFARAAAQDPYPPGRKTAEYANDPNEIQVRYDLYRIPFNGGRGGRAEPVAGASANGMSNNFPKISPDGRWIIFVQCRNGQLMRPDSQLYIVPFEGGRARRMQCNTPLMNSWHSFAPNGRWLVFSSKSRSPYTQMFLTHIDEEGRDTPAILIEDATAANRAVNIPEFVNPAAAQLARIDVPALDSYRRFADAVELTRKGEYDEAIALWKSVIAMSPRDPRAHNNLGFALARRNRLDDALVHLETALELNPRYAPAHNNLALVLEAQGKLREAISHWRAAAGIDPASAAACRNLAWALSTSPQDSIRNGQEAVVFAERALRLSGPGDPALLHTLAAAYAEAGRFREAVETERRAIALGEDHPRITELRASLVLFENHTPLREKRQ